MTLDAATVGDTIDDFFLNIENSIATEVTGKSLPFLGTLNVLPGIGEINSKLEAFRAKIHEAIDGVAAPDLAKAIVDAINDAAITGLTAIKTASGGIALSIDYSASVDTGTATLNLGDTAGSFLDLSVDAGAHIDTALKTTVEFGADGKFSIQNQADPDLVVNLTSDLSINDLTAKLGVVTVSVSDHDAVTPELTATTNIDLSTAADGTIKAAATLDVDARLDLDFDGSDILAGLLPDVKGELLIDVPVTDLGLGDPSISVKNVTLDLKSYLDIVGSTGQKVGDVFNASPFSQLIDVALAPIPGFDDIARKIPPLLDMFDKTGSITGGGDGHITVGDLAIYGNPSLEPAIDRFYQVLAVIDILRKFDSIADLGDITIGDGSLTPSGPVTSLSPDQIRDQLLDKLDGVLPDAVRDFLSDFDISGPTLLAAGDGEDPFSFGLLEHPEQVLNLLFTDKPVNLVEFNVPDFDFSVTAGGFFPVLGPLGFVLEGQLKAHVDFNVGYDSYGLSTGNPFDGFYLTTPMNTGMFPDIPVIGDFDPVGTIGLTLTGGAGIGYAGSRLSVDASFLSTLYAFFEGATLPGSDGKFRPGTDDIGCIFSPVGGTAGVSIDVTIKIDFGLFDVTKHINIARAHLGDFTVFECPPPTVEPTPEAPGLATQNGSDLLLNVGPRSDLRLIVDHEDGVAKHAGPVDIAGTPEDESTPEFYIIGRAVDRTDDSLTGPGTATIVPGKLDVQAFGFTQRTDIPSFIKANFADGGDALVIQDDLAIDSIVSGGKGGDYLSGGAGKDNFHGDQDNDALYGGMGNDELYGGDGDDDLSGGKGADIIDGGDGYDTVSYADANRDVGVGISIFMGPISYTGSGGEAQGDVLSNVESIIGTDFNDVISAANVPFAVYLDGGSGDDVLIGGVNNDLLMGGAGADAILGGMGEDGTSYITSWAAVDIDMLRAVQFGGDAQGDYLDSVEDIQTTGYDDTIKGDNSANALDTGDGNDTIEGRGGADIITAGSGNDLIYAIGDGDTIDGGVGTDTLSYEHRFLGVSVNLGAAQNADGSFNASAAPDHIVAESVTIEVAGLEVTSYIPNDSTIENLIGTQFFGDTLIGDRDDNRISGLGGNDFINGADGDDKLVGGAGADTLIGGDGFDWVEYAGAPDGVTVDLINGGSGSDAQGDTFAGVENILGSTNSDVLLGNAANNIIDPFVTFKSGTDFVDGRGGIDTLRVDYSGIFTDSGRGVIGGFTNFATGTGSLTRSTKDGSATLDTVNFTNIERLNIVGTTKTDIIIGGNGGDIINTQSGSDLIAAGKGADIVTAGAGNDIVGYGTGTNGQLVDYDGASPFFLSGGRGIDSLYLSLNQASYDIILSGAAPGTEFFGKNLITPGGGGAVVDFEILRDVYTGLGNDSLTQLGRVDNIFATGDGNDIITPGLGRDMVDGGYNSDGLSHITQVNDVYTVAVIENRLAVAAAAGDTLVLDYSSLEAGYRVVSAQISRLSLVAGDANENNTFILTNKGAFATIDTAVFGDSGIPENVTAEDTRDSVVYDNIERVDITGSQSNDIISGTDNVLNPNYFVSATGTVPIPLATSGGQDILSGLAGDDEIYGGGGSDRIFGGDGKDFLQGTDIHESRNVDASLSAVGEVSVDAVIVNPYNGYYDAREIDLLTGGADADTFVVGDENGSFYRNSNIYSSDVGRAIIPDFAHDEGDVIQLYGLSSFYRTEETDAGTLIYFRDGFDGNADADDLVAEVQGAFDLDLDSDAFSYVGGRLASARSAASVEDAPSTSSLFSDLQHASAALTPAQSVIDGTDLTMAGKSDAPVLAKLAVQPLADPAFTVTQESDAAILSAKLAGAGNVVSSSLTLSGSAEAFGTFENDPFGLGKGIILSTGRVEDLPGENTLSSGGTNVTTIPINFVKIGRSGNADIFVADISNLGVDIKSLKLTDSGSATGGAGGVASGFDLGGIALSHTLLSNVTDATNLDSAAILPRLDVFDFSNASIVYTPGSQHGPAPSNFPYADDLTGSVNGLVDTARVGFGTFGDVLYDEASDFGTLTLGDGGSIGFNLTTPVKANGPLYLYLAESGGSGEIVNGQIEVSGDTVVPTGDLSTDLGMAGEAGDDTVLTYTFQPKAGDNAFSFDAVLFSEELPEFDGVDLSDLFSIKLNGVEIGTLNNGTALSLKSLVYSGSTDLVMNPVGTGPLADQIKADAYTKTLTISGLVTPGVDNVLTIEIKDQRDAFLDSGLLIKDGSFKTFTLPTFTAQPVDPGTGGFGGAAEPGDCVDFTVALPPGTVLTSPVDVLVDPSGNLDLGGGAGQPVTVHFIPGGPLSFELCATVLPGSNPNEDGTITFDPSIEGLSIPPIVIDVIPPDSSDPFLIFDRLAGDVFDGLTSGNDVANAKTLPGPTSFHIEEAHSGKDTLLGFGKSDILIFDKMLFDSNHDGLIGLGKNRLLDIDGPNSKGDTLKFLDPTVKGLRYMGSDTEGHSVYATDSVRPKGAKESKLGDDTLVGTAKKDIFFFDTSLDMNLGHDQIQKMGDNDLIVTTSAIFDADGNGKVTTGGNHAFDLNGNSFFEGSHGSSQYNASPFGQIAVTNYAGAQVDSLYFDGMVARDGVTYFVYSITQQSVDGLAL